MAETALDTLLLEYPWDLVCRAGFVRACLEAYVAETVRCRVMGGRWPVTLTSLKHVAVEVLRESGPDP